eukprot:COSAG05_NODE_1508_length_4689_cov_7.953595_2_plen_115_part_00
MSTKRGRIQSKTCDLGYVSWSGSARRKSWSGSARRKSWSGRWVKALQGFWNQRRLIVADITSAASSRSVSESPSEEINSLAMDGMTEEEEEEEEEEEGGVKHRLRWRLLKLTLA